MKIDRRDYEVKPEGVGREKALERVIADITSASNLGLPFQVETVHFQAFRHGGNVSKADVVQYRVSVGSYQEVDN